MSNVGRVAAQAANTLTTPLNVEDVFSTYLYTGNGSTQTITNGIDLAGEGGLVWIKARDGGAQWSRLYDTERGGAYSLVSSDTTAQLTGTGPVTFNSDSFDIGSNNSANVNSLDRSYASWTFRKAPKFFDVVTYTGDGTNGRQIPHNLGSNIGMVICKGVDVVTTWAVKHKDRPTDEGQLNSTNAFAGYGNFPTSFAGFTDTYFTVNAGGSTNANGYTYVAYLFAHNDGDGDFGDGTQDIIKCGSYTGNDGINSINLGFEAQWVLIKNTSSTSNWELFDVMRGMAVGTSSVAASLQPNQSNAEYVYPSNAGIYPTANGFEINSSQSNFNASPYNYIYIAIRRGPMAVPESATDVFAIDTRGTGTQPPAYHSGFPVDMALSKYNVSGWEWLIGSRLTQATTMQTNSTVAESGVAEQVYDYMDGYYNSTNTSTTYISWMWKRAPNYFDVVAYTGNGVAGRTVSHNLGVAPEMIWVKKRSGADENWYVYHSGIGATKRLKLNLTDAEQTALFPFNNTAPTATEFTLAASVTGNGNGDTYIAYLFASLDGVSKVGSYTGNGSTQTINCGFSSGARFVLIKRTDSTGDWYIWDTERGIVAANDPHLSLNTTAAQVTTDDSIDPVSSGFAVNQVAATNINVSSASYIYYAIA